MSRTNPTYTSSALNEPVTLYRGLMTLHEDEHHPRERVGDCLVSLGSADRGSSFSWTRT